MNNNQKQATEKIHFIARGANKQLYLFNDFSFVVGHILDCFHYNHHSFRALSIYYGTFLNSSVQLRFEQNENEKCFRQICQTLQVVAGY